MVTIERTTGIDRESVAALRATIEGEVITPEDASYGSARQLWNAVFQKFPAVIIRAATTEDVARAVRFANEQEAAIAVRSGGHNLAGLSSNDDGVVIDLSQMGRSTSTSRRGRPGCGPASPPRYSPPRPCRTGSS